MYFRNWVNRYQARWVHFKTVQYDLVTNVISACMIWVLFSTSLGPCQESNKIRLDLSSFFQKKNWSGCKKNCMTWSGRIFIKTQHVLVVFANNYAWSGPSLKKVQKSSASSGLGQKNVVTGLGTKKVVLDLGVNSISSNWFGCKNLKE